MYQQKIYNTAVFYLFFIFYLQNIIGMNGFPPLLGYSQLGCPCSVIGSIPSHQSDIGGSRSKGTRNGHLVPAFIQHWNIKELQNVLH